MTKTITVTANSVAGMVHKIDELPFTDEPLGWNTATIQRTLRTTLLGVPLSCQ